MKRDSKTNFLILASLVLFFGLVVFTIEYQSTHFSLSTPGPTRQVITNSIGWVEKWRQPLSLVGDGAASDNTLIVPMLHTDGVRLLALGTANGQPIWEQELGHKYGAIDSITADKDRVYLAGAFVVRAFDVADGHPLWATPELYAHTSSEILPLDQTGTIQAQVFNFGGEATIFDIDAQNGAVKSAQDYPRVLKLKTDDTTYYVYYNHDFISSDNQSGQTRWVAKTPGVAGSPALIDSSALVFQSGSYLTRLVGLDPTSGKTLWQTEEENQASNFIVLNDTIYVMTTEPAIVAYDGLTGKEMNRLVFGGGLLDTNHAPDFWLLKDDSHVFVYFSDSQELIAFSLKQ